jgi:hypothetical protein
MYDQSATGFFLEVQTSKSRLLVAGVLLIAAIGKPIRRFRLKHTEIRQVSGKI